MAYHWRHWRWIHISFAYDVSTACLSLALVSGLQNPSLTPSFSWFSYGMMALIAAAFSFWTQSYRASWRFISVFDLVGSMKTAFLTALVGVPLLHHGTGLNNLEAWVVGQGIILCFLWTAPRCVYRTLCSPHHRFLGLWPHDSASDGLRVLWVGPHTPGAMEPSCRSEDKTSGSFSCIGSITAYPRHVGQTIQGIPVLGTLHHMEHVVHQCGAGGKHPHEVWVSQGTLSSVELAQLRARSQALHLPMRLLLDEDRPSSQHPVANFENSITAQELLERPALRFPAKGLQSFFYHKRLVLCHVDLVYGSWVEMLMAYAPQHVLFLDDDPQRLVALQERFRAHPWFHQCHFRAIPHPDLLPLDLGEEGPVDMILFFPLYDILCCQDMVYVHAAWSHVAWIDRVATAGMHRGCETHVLISPDTSYLSHQTFEGALWFLCEAWWQSMNATAQQRALRSRFLIARMPPLLHPSQGVMAEILGHSSQEHVWHLKAYERAPWVSEQEMQALLCAMLSLVPKMDGVTRHTVCAVDIPFTSTSDLVHRVVTRRSFQASEAETSYPEIMIPVHPSPRVNGEVSYVETSLKHLGYLSPARRISGDHLKPWIEAIQARAQDASPMEMYHLLIQAMESCQGSGFSQKNS